MTNNKRNLRSLAAELSNAAENGLLDDLAAYVDPDIINQIADALDEMDTAINFPEYEDEIREREERAKWLARAVRDKSP